MEKLTYRQKKHLVTSVCAFLAVLLAAVLLFLMRDYNKKQREESSRLFLEDIEQYEASKEKMEYGDDKDALLTRKQQKYDVYQKLKEHLQVNILFLGDDIASGAGVSSSENNWVMLVANAIEKKYGSDIKGGTYAKPGTSAFYGYHIMNSYSRGLTYDIMIVAYGSEDDPETFEFYYDGLMHSIKNQNPKCEIYCIIEARTDGENDNAEKIREICDYYGGIVIDMNEYYAEHGLKAESLTSDGKIPNVAGCTKYYDAVIEVIDDCLEADRRVPSVKTARLESSRDFDNYKYTMIADMKKISDTVYETSVNGSIAALIYFKSFSGGNINIWVNGKKTITESNVLSENVARTVASRIISSELDGVTKIRIETDDASNVSNILGVAYCGEEK